MSLKLGLIGCGGIAHQHHVGFESVADRAPLTAVADIDKANRAWFAERVPGLAEFDDFNDMIANANIDAVDICLPHHLHFPAIMAAIKAGKDWICEKPLCLNLDEARQIDQAMTKTNLIGMSAHNQVFLPTLCEAKRLIDAGQIGKPYMIISQDCFILGLHNPGDLPGTKPASPISPDTWRAKKELMGGGELIDTGYHPTYRLLFLADGQPETVAAVTARYRAEDLEGEDSATVLLKMSDGVTGLIRTSWAIELPAGHNLFHIIGQHGELFGDETTLTFKPSRFSQPAQVTFEPRHTFQAEIEHFVDCLQTRTPPVQSYRDGIAVLELITNAYNFVRENNAGVC